MINHVDAGWQLAELRREQMLAEAATQLLRDQAQLGPSHRSRRSRDEAANYVRLEWRKHLRPDELRSAFPRRAESMTMI